jgi:hypothetical protein
MKRDRVHLMAQYALAVAGEADSQKERELGPIHLLKYLYLADLAYAQSHHGETFSQARWRFYKFGPWAVEVYADLSEAAAQLGAQERHFRSKYSDDQVRWLLADVDATELGGRLPASISAAIGNDVRRFKNDTVSLLHHVYRTRPMLSAAPGEYLVFEPAPEKIDPASLGAVGDESGSKPLPTISKTKLKRLRERIAKLHQAREEREKRELVLPDPPPVYDEVYFQGVEWLDSLAGAPIETTRGNLVFDDSIWKSEGRRDPELP